MITTREVFQPYRDAGICALPVLPQKKSPLVEWTPYQDRLPTGEEYEKWINEFKLVGVWIVCGSVSGVVALDCDTDAAIERAYREIGAEILDATTCVSTSKGRCHWYFTIPAGEVIPSWSEDGYELHAEKTGVVAPPSLHKSGVSYRFIRDLECMQPLPDTLRHRNGSNEHAEGGEPRAAPKVAKDGLAALLTTLPAEGDRNVWLTKVCGHFAKQHAFKDGYLANVDLANKSLKTPLGAGEVEKTSESIWSAEKRQAAGKIQHLTDTGNAERVVAYCEDRVRYCAADGRWYIFDGKRWAPDETRHIEQLRIPLQAEH